MCVPAGFYSLTEGATSSCGFLHPLPLCSSEPPLSPLKQRQVLACLGSEMVQSISELHFACFFRTGPTLPYIISCITLVVNYSEGYITY